MTKAEAKQQITEAFQYEAARLGHPTARVSFEDETDAGLSARLASSKGSLKGLDTVNMLRDTFYRQAVYYPQFPGRHAESWFEDEGASDVPTELVFTFSTEIAEHWQAASRKFFTREELDRVHAESVEHFMDVLREHSDVFLNDDWNFNYGFIDGALQGTFTMSAEYPDHKFKRGYMKAAQGIPGLGVQRGFIKQVAPDEFEVFCEDAGYHTLRGN